MSIVDDEAGEIERQVESALRPQNLEEFVGQVKVRRQLGFILNAAKTQSRAADHILLAGPPGLGKTTLAMIVAAESNHPIRITSGPTITHAGDLASILSSLQEGEVLFIDEIHRMSRPAEEMLYLAMEDFRVDVMVGKGPGATSIPLQLPQFTLVGATTRSGLLPSPLRDRFGFTAHLEYYGADDLKHILQRSAKLLEIELPAEAAELLSSRSRGTPRIANRLLRRVRDFAVVENHPVNLASVEKTLEIYEVDDFGLDRLDRSVLDALITNFSGGPVGLKTLAVAVGEEAETVEEVVEPFLLRLGMLRRTNRGRVATPQAYKHLGKPLPDSGLFDSL